MVVGHAHPKITEAVTKQINRGSHFAQPVEDGVVVARELGAPLQAAAVALHQLRHRVDPWTRCASRAGSRDANAS